MEPENLKQPVVRPQTLSRPSHHYPENLVYRDQWIVWSPTEDGRKIPRAPWANPGWPDKYVSAKDPAHWVTHSEASKWASQRPEYGLGFVLTRDDPYSVIDGDGVRNPETGALHPTARELVNRTRSYADVSPSATGVHIIVRGALPDGLRAIGKTRLPVDSDYPEATIEIYSFDQFITMSGTHLPGTALRVGDGQALLEELAEEYAPGPIEPSESEIGEAPEVGQSILTRLTRAMLRDPRLRALYEGRYADAGLAADRSRAECSLAERLGYWFWRDPEVVHALIKRSMAEHPRTDRGQARKWVERGERYRASVLRYATADPTKFYDRELSPYRKIVSDRVVDGIFFGLVDLGEASTEELREYLRKHRGIDRSIYQVRRGIRIMRETGLVIQVKRGNRRLYSID